MKVRVGISTKLILMATPIVVGAIMIIITIATSEFREDSLTRVQEANKDYAETLAAQSFATFKSAIEKLTLISDVVTQGLAKGSGDAGLHDSVLTLLRQNDDLLSYGLYEYLPEKQEYDEKYFEAKKEALAEFNLSLEEFKTHSLKKIQKRISQLPDDVAILNTSPEFGFPVLTLAFLTKENEQKKRFLVRTEIRPDPLLKLFSRKEFVSGYLVDVDGSVLVHKDPKLVLKAQNLSAAPIVEKIKEKKLNNHQMEFTDMDGELYLGAYKTIGVAGSAVVAQTLKSDALATVDRVQRRAMLVTGIVVCLAFILNLIFSQSLTSPLGALVEATEQISKGNFNFKMNSKSHDEIGVLTEAFQKMTQGLKERDKLKTTFNKFHSQEIAKKILSGQIKLGGERKVGTVFFSDIRNFTAISESSSPDQVVQMLNEYFTEMVRIITKYKGVVDKYIGDSIMALWGIPHGNPDDARNAIMAALEMRQALVHLNKRRKLRGQPEIRVGMGLHTGPLLAGNIGSEQRLEYTVIGDTVNQASRLEAATKVLGSDLLISEQMYALVKREVAVGPARTLHLKGKLGDVVAYQVIGVKDRNGTLHTSLTAEEQQAILKGPEEVAFDFSEESKANISSHEVKVPNFEQDTGVDFSTIEKPRDPAPDIASLPKVVKPRGHAEWYLVRDPRKDEWDGPFTLEELRVQSLQPGFPFASAYIFKEGDREMTPVSSVAELGKRKAMPLITAPLPEEELRVQASEGEWYISMGDDRVYGPYSVDQIKEALANEHITRTTYAWKKDLPNWIYVYEIPGFDRRKQNPDQTVRLAPQLPHKKSG